MPVYEYQCGDCNKRFELFFPQRIGSEGVICQNCHGDKVRKLVSTFASQGGVEEMAFSGAESAPSTGGGCCGGSCGCGH